MHPYYYSLPLGLVWPLLHILVFVIRFASFPTQGLFSSLVFYPMGIFSMLALLYYYQRTPHKAIIIGYVIASPFALIASILGGLLPLPTVSVTIVGTLPLLLGVYLAHLYARNLYTANSQEQYGRTYQ